MSLYCIYKFSIQNNYIIFKISCPGLFLKSSKNRGSTVASSFEVWETTTPTLALKVQKQKQSFYRVFTNYFIIHQALNKSEKQRKSRPSRCLRICDLNKHRFNSLSIFDFRFKKYSITCRISTLFSVLGNVVKYGLSCSI